jgi:uncharacterized membrane protein YbhN (UPF0104 family)
LRSAIRLAVGLLILGLLAGFVGTEKVVRGVRAMSWGVFLPALGMYLAAQAACAVKWRFIAGSMGISQPPWKYLVLYLSGMFMNIFLPTTIGGDAGRAYLLAGRQEWRKGVVSVLGERYAGFVVLSVVLSLGLLLRGEAVPAAAAVLFKILPAAVIVLPYLLVFAVANRRPGLLPVDSDTVLLVSGLLSNARVMALSLGLSAIFYGIYIGMHLLIGNGLGISLSPWAFVVVTTLTSIVGMLPVSLGGLGLREGSYLYLLSLYGIDKSLGLAFGVAVLAVNVTLSLIGGAILYVCKTTGKL